MPKENFLTQFITRDSAIAALADLENYCEEAFFGGEAEAGSSKIETGKSSLNPPASNTNLLTPSSSIPAMESGLNPALSRVIESLTRENYVGEIENMRRKIEEAPLLRLSVATPETEKLAGKLKSWVQENLSADTLLDIGYDPSLLIGAKVSLGGREMEHSLRRNLSERQNILAKILQGKSLEN